MCHVRVCSVVKLETIEIVEGRRHRSLEEEEEKVWEERERERYFLRRYFR